MTDDKNCKVKSFLCPPMLQGRTAASLLIIRLIMGSAFVLHGMGKITQPFVWMGDAVPGFLQALAAFAEFGGGIALILGLLTPLAALGILITMTVAVLMVHVPAGHTFVTSDPTQHTFELPLIYWAVALLLTLSGPGAYSVDAQLAKRCDKSADAPSENTSAE